MYQGCSVWRLKASFDRGTNRAWLQLDFPVPAFLPVLIGVTSGIHSRKCGIGCVRAQR